MFRPRSALALAAPALLIACGDGTAPIVCEMDATLQVGQALVTNPTANDPGCGILIPSGAPGSRYRVGIVRPDSAGPDATTSVTLVLEGLGVTSVVTTAPQGL